MKNSGSLIGAVILGVAVGAAIGVLVAPAKGSETRKKLLDGAKDLADNLMNKISNDPHKQELEEHHFYENVISDSNPKHQLT